MSLLVSARPVTVTAQPESLPADQRQLGRKLAVHKAEAEPLQRSGIQTAGSPVGGAAHAGTTLIHTCAMVTASRRSESWAAAAAQTTM